jgi:hypothetical protein
MTPVAIHRNRPIDRSDGWPIEKATIESKSKAATIIELERTVRESATLAKCGPLRDVVWTSRPSCPCVARGAPSPRLPKYEKVGAMVLREPVCKTNAVLDEANSVDRRRALLKIMVMLGRVGVKLGESVIKKSAVEWRLNFL